MALFSTLINLLLTIVLTPILMLAEWAGGQLGWDPYPLVEAMTKPGMLWLRDLLGALGL